MKSPIVFRCDFRQPKGPVMNPLGIKMNVPIPVEIYHARSAPPQEWRVRRPGTKVLFKIAPQQSPGILQSQIEMHCFEVRVGNWKAFDTRCDPPREVLADEWRFDQLGAPHFTELYEARRRAEREKGNTVTK
jgi:hypothetical protein